jgi:hypothetical protein
VYDSGGGYGIVNNSNGKFFENTWMSNASSGSRMKAFTLCFLLIAVPTYAQDARNPSQLQTRSDQTRNCQRYNDEDSTLVTFDCTTTEVLKAVPMPRERFTAETNSVELIDRKTGALIKSIPAGDDFPKYGLSQQDMDELAHRCEDSLNKRGDPHRWCVATQNAERVKAEHSKELMAIPHVANIGIEGSGGQFGVALNLQVECPKDLPSVEARAPKEIEGIPIKVEPIPVGTDLVKRVECKKDLATGKSECYDVNMQCDPYLDLKTCKPHCWYVTSEMK